MGAEDTLGQQWYQRPLPGMEAPAYPHENAVQIPVENIFKYGEHPASGAEYQLTQNFLPQTVKVRTDAIRPTQGYVDENTIHNPRGGKPAVIKNSKGHYLLVDGHHRVAAALLDGKKHIEVLKWER